MNLWVLLQGFGLGASMILPIGAQNAYVLNQGIKRQHHLTTATICSFLDMFFISIGIFGGGALLASNETLLFSVTLGGVAFLSYYGYLSFKRALFPIQENSDNQLATSRGRQTVIIGALMVTVFNPHLYLDTVVVLGSIGGQLQGIDRLSFAVGSVIASFSWFFALSIGAAKLGPTLSKPKVKQGIDLFIAIVMFIIAFNLAMTLLKF
jgi:L-lysine exporter family protein LysE/ArgO